MEAQQKFASYLEQYDKNDDKIRLKAVHTFGVVQAAGYIAAALGLSPQDQKLAATIALLHDIGRFEQLRRYHTFDDAVMPHAQCSIQILFRDGMIREFEEDRSLDSIIYNAIRLHGVYRLPKEGYRHYVWPREPLAQGSWESWEEQLEEEADPAERERILLHTKIIRDADKVDNFRVKAEEPVETMVDVSARQLGREAITQDIFDTFMRHTPILNSNRKTHMDMWVSYFGYLFDFNFASGLKYIQEKQYVEAMADRIVYTNLDTAEKMRLIRSEALSYIEKRIKGRVDET